MSVKPRTQWLCKKCKTPLSGEMGDLRVEFRGINGQSVELEYLSIFAKCKKCNTEQEKQGVLFEDLQKIKQITLESNKRNEMMLKLVELWEKGLLKIKD